ncbi:MAG: glycosyltransferase family 4 protein [Desulfuromonadaceae bacterium]|nr:glycosyltransferase family 4 protein [Desulfuromonadaceae bacterium]MDD2848198.1 glycosyltransferase family 4 protein [Desulfuromonadaceae bacterium]MDD4130635.1 glycosyltransferase family 4 protein [Desulfuromonadaceae bacterium]
MKIILVNNGKGWSGGQEHLKDLAIELRNNGVEVHFLVRADTVNETRFAELGFTVHLMPYKYGWNGIKAISNLVAVMRRERFDIVSINREHDLALTVLAYKLAFPGKRHGRLMMSYHLPTERKQLLLGAVDAIVCISEHVKTKLVQSNPVAADKTTVLYYGIVLPQPPEETKFSRNRPRRFLAGRPFPVIGMVGEFWKNQIELVEMLPQLKQDFPKITVAFIGNNADQTLVKPLDVRARELGVEDNIVFTGLVPRQKIHDMFYDLDISVTTHRNEGFGIVHLESLASGTPVVAYNEGGFVDIFKGEDVGVIIDGGSTDFAAATVALLKDDERRFVMGRAGYKLVEKRYSLKAMGQTYLNFYNQLLDTTIA